MVGVQKTMQMKSMMNSEKINLNSGIHLREGGGIGVLTK